MPMKVQVKFAGQYEVPDWYKGPRPGDDQQPHRKSQAGGHPKGPGKGWKPSFVSGYVGSDMWEPLPPPSSYSEAARRAWNLYPGKGGGKGKDPDSVTPE